MFTELLGPVLDAYLRNYDLPMELKSPVLG